MVLVGQSIKVSGNKAYTSPPAFLLIIIPARHIPYNPHLLFSIM
ncbi:hypothetical protein MY3296_007117 [Beauveria thailandica]